MSELLQLKTSGLPNIVYMSIFWVLPSATKEFRGLSKIRSIADSGRYLIN